MLVYTKFYFIFVYWKDYESANFCLIHLKLEIMATIILDYDARNMQAQKALDFIMSMGIFKTRKDSAVKIESLSAKRKKLDEELGKYLIDLSGFKFNRDEANDYE